ncbi:MAG: hypothetical protein K0U84_20515 [Actinomycetia bacterium]|nr:hypothetical protein [Actinomycetes bacterium]
MTHMLTMYLCGALIGAAATIGATIRFSGSGTPVTTVTRVSVAVLAGALWPLLAVGVLQGAGISLLARRRVRVALVSPELRTPRDLMLSG